MTHTFMGYMRLNAYTKALGAVLALAAAGLIWHWAKPGPRVEVMRAQSREVVELVIASGKLRPVRQSELGAEVSGVIERVMVDYGDTVEKGQALIVLRREDAEQEVVRARRAVETARQELQKASLKAYPEDLNRAEAELARATAACRQAQADFERTNSLYEKKVASRNEFDQSQSVLDQARAAERVARESLESLRQQPRAEDVEIVAARLREREVEQAKAERELARRTMTAPWGGVVLKRMAEPGQSVVPGAALLTLAQTAETEIYVETDENNLGRLKVGQPATIIAPSYRQQPFQALVTQIGPGVDYDRGVVGLRLKPLALPDYARMNMTVDVNIEVGRIASAPSLPVSSLVEKDGKSRIYTLSNGQIGLRDVQVLGRSPEWFAVEGLDANTWVVVHATEVRPGSRARALEVTQP